MNLFRFLFGRNNKQNRSNETLVDIIIRLPDNVTELYEFLRVHSLFNDIILYTTNINKIIDMLENDKIVPSYYIKKDIIEIFIRDFFIHDGYDIDKENSLHEFHKSCIVLFNIHHDLLNNNEKTFNQNKNMITIKPIINNVIIVFGDLKNAIRGR